MKLHEKIKGWTDVNNDQYWFNLAAEVGVDRATVASWRSGEAMPTAVNALKLSRVVHIPLEILLDDAVDWPPTKPSEAEQRKLNIKIADKVIRDLRNSSRELGLSIPLTHAAASQLNEAMGSIENAVKRILDAVEAR